MSVTSFGKHITVISAGGPYCNGSLMPENPKIGQPWYNGNTRRMEVFTGTGWIAANESVDVSVNMSAEIAIDWAIEQERKNMGTIKDLADKYPTVREALEQLEMVLKLHQNLE